MLCGEWGLKIVRRGNNFQLELSYTRPLKQSILMLKSLIFSEVFMKIFLATILPLSFDVETISSSNDGIMLPEGLA